MDHESESNTQIKINITAQSIILFGLIHQSDVQTLTSKANQTACHQFVVCKLSLL